MHSSSSGFNKILIKNSLNFLEFGEIVSVVEMCGVWCVVFVFF